MDNKIVKDFYYYFIDCYKKPLENSSNDSSKNSNSSKQEELVTTNYFCFQRKIKKDTKLLDIVMKYREKMLLEMFSNAINCEVYKVIDKSHGRDHTVKLLETSEGNLIVKAPLIDKVKILNEVTGTKLCKKRHLSVPEIIYSDELIVIETAIDGVELSNWSGSVEEYDNIYYQLGQIMKQMHTICCKGYGKLVNSYDNKHNICNSSICNSSICNSSICNSNNSYCDIYLNSNSEEIIYAIGEYNNLADAIDANMKVPFDDMRKQQYFTEEECEQIIEYYETNKSCMSSCKQGVLLHNDLNDDNIIVNNRISNTSYDKYSCKINGIIDFGDVCIGSPMQDFVKVYINHYGTHKFASLLDGYGAYDINHIKFYVFCELLWGITEKLKQGDDLLSFMKEESLFRDIWG